MSPPKLLVVFGATGNQGGSVVDEFLNQPSWQIRALTRNTSSAKAQSLASRGVQVVHADFDKPETLPAVLEDANAVFATTDFWGLYHDPANNGKPKPGQMKNEWAGEHETLQLKHIINAVAMVPTLERFVLSPVFNVTKWSNGNYTHKTYLELWKRTSLFQAGFCLSNWVDVNVMGPVKDEQGVIQFVGYIEQDVKIPVIAPDEDTGPFVRELIVTEASGKNIIAYRAWLTVKELAESFSRATGMKAEVVTLPKGQFPSTTPMEMQLELGDNFAYVNEFGFEARDDPTVTHPQQLQSPPRLATVEEYWKKQDWSKVFGA